MTPIRCGCIVESEEEYDALRRESKRSVSIRCFVFEICMLMFLIASIAISAVIVDSDEAFLVFYIMYIIAAVISLALISIVLFSVYDKKDLTSGSFRFAMRAPLCTTISVLSALSGVVFYGLFTVSLDYWTAAWNLPVPVFVCLFSFVSAIFDFILFAYMMIWLARWRKPWAHIARKLSVSEERGTDEAAENSYDVNSDILALKERLAFLENMHAEGLLDDGEYAEAKKQALTLIGRGR